MKRRIALIVVLLVVATVLVLLHSTAWLASLGGKVEGARLARARRSPQFHDGRFRNREPKGPGTASNREMLRRQFFGDEQREPVDPVPVVQRTTGDYATPPASGLRATWMGWSSVLVEIDGAKVLTDPVWSTRCSPSTLVGPKRFHAPPIALDELPPIDAVVISHDHYDHLDMPVVRALTAHGTHFIVPLGIGAHLERWGTPAAQIHELDWNESFALRGLTFTATPARHYSGRNPRRKNETLWATWVVKGPRHRFFFSGDSGYTDQFKTIGATHGPFDLTLIKIGASDPSWVEIHMSPEEAVQTHRDVRGRVMLPVHWATFNLGFHAWREPPDRALAAAAKAGATLIVPRLGTFVEPGTVQPKQEVWWGSPSEVAPAPPPDTRTDVVTLSPERVAADRIRLILQNGFNGPVGYNLCTSALQVRASSEWQDVRTGDICTMELKTLPPGQDATFEKRLPADLPAGEYRYVASVEIPIGTPQIRVVTAPFQVK